MRIEFSRPTNFLQTQAVQALFFYLTSHDSQLNKVAEVHSFVDRNFDVVEPLAGSSAFVHSLENLVEDIGEVPEGNPVVVEDTFVVERSQDKELDSKEVVGKA